MYFCWLWNSFRVLFVTVIRDVFLFIYYFIYSIDLYLYINKNIRWNHAARFFKLLATFKLTHHATLELCFCFLSACCCCVIAHIIMLDTKKHPHPAHSGEPICTFISILCMSPSNIPSSPPSQPTQHTVLVYFRQ